MNAKEIRTMLLCSNIELFFPVVEELSRSYDMEPVFWSANAKHKEAIKNKFPDIVFFDSLMNGLYSTPEYLKPDFNYSYITPALLEKFSVCEHVFMEMLYTRADSGGGFNFYEAQAAYHRSIVQAFALLDYFQPNVLIFQTTPHMMWDYILYVVAEYKGLQTIMLADTPIPGRMVVYKNLSSGELTEKNSLIKKEVPEKLQNYIDSVKGDFASGTTYMIKSSLPINGSEHYWSVNQIRKRVYSQIKSSKKLLRKENVNKFLGKASADVTGKHYLKQSGKSWFHSFQNVFEFHVQRIKDIKKRKYLLERYELLSVEPDFTQPYIYYPLHWQPENTTVPMGGVLSDQYMALKLLRDAIPDNYQIYIKENPGQFEWHRGSFARNPTFYDDFVDVEGVKIVKMESDPFALIDHSVCIYTITGTVGWEAVVRGKVALVTGKCVWYKDIPGSYNVDSVETIRDVFQKIINNEACVDEERFKQFVYRLVDRTYECVLSSAHVDRLVDDKEKNVDEAIRAVVDSLDVAMVS